MKKRAIIHYLIPVAFIASIALMAGCGGGGGGGGGGGVTKASTIVTGTASKGVIYPGTVNLYGVDAAAGTKRTTPLKTVSTKSDGTFIADIGVYSGALILEASGTYTDEATNTTVTIDPATPLHAVVDLVDDTANNNRPVAVTPLTELAYKLVGGDFTATKIIAANKLVSELFKVSDIIAIQPVEPNAAILGGVSVSTEQQAYTIALATLSRMAETNTGNDGTAAFADIEAFLDSFKNDITGTSDSALSPANMAAFATALETVASPSSDLSGFTSAISNLSAVGAKTLKLTIGVGDVPSGVQLGTLNVTLTLPAGVSVRTDDSGQAQKGMISGLGAVSTITPLGYYQPTANTLTIGLYSSAGFGAGDCMTVTLDVKSGTQVTASNITATLNEAYDLDVTGKVAGVTIVLR